MTAKAFVIHGTHDIVVLYYVKLPNDYLAAIAKHGVNFRQYSATKKVTLQHTKRFHLRKTAQRVEFFEVLVRLLWYLRSGESHVGFLHNFEGNPLHTIVIPVSYRSDE